MFINFKYLIYMFAHSSTCLKNLIINNVVYCSAKLLLLLLCISLEITLYAWNWENAFYLCK